MGMFCYQCQEAAHCTGCTIQGVCGKKENTAGLQDTLVYEVKKLCYLVTKVKENGIVCDNEGKCNTLADTVMRSLFITITNANFDNTAIQTQIDEVISLQGCVTQKLAEKNVTVDVPVKVGVLSAENEDVRSLREMITYGLKGMAAYGFHASMLGFYDMEANMFIVNTLAKLLDDTLDGAALTGLALETGKYSVSIMALLDKANTTTYGHPEITKVNIGVGQNPGIIITGHDLKDLEELLIQTQGTGVDVYTHSEMLPAHYYPAFKKYPHFVGNYGNAWWKQVEEFETFNGAVLFTSNCLVPPRPNSTYKNRCFTTGAAGFEGMKYIPMGENGKIDFSEIIAIAKTCKPPVEIEKGEIIGGFAHNQVFALADAVVGAVKSGAIKQFYVMGGCDGRHKEREYFTEFALALPQDAVILTAGCAKYRYNKLNLGDIGGIPRVLDAGQCNDCYSLAVIALKLKEVFELDDVNKLPITFNIGWYEQKAVTVLLALLHLGFKNINLGPTLPAFLSPNVAKVLIDTFNIGGISGDAKADIARWAK